jgi:hypothetical protein
LGDGTTEDKSKAISIGISNVVKISGGDHYNIIVRENGKAYAFGRNNDGQIGDYSTNNRLEMFEVLMDNSRIVDVCAASSHTVILKGSGKAYGFGRNSVRKKDSSKCCLGRSTFNWRFCSSSLCKKNRWVECNFKYCLWMAYDIVLTTNFSLLWEITNGSSNLFRKWNLYG